MSAEPAGDDVVVGEEPEYEEKLDEAPKSILMGMMRQLKVGMDLSRITLPAFILEPRSFLEKCSDFMSHGHHLLRYGTCALISIQLNSFPKKITSIIVWDFIKFIVGRLSEVQDPTQRMLAITRWYLSSWHLKPPVFTCRIRLICHTGFRSDIVFIRVSKNRTTQFWVKFITVNGIMAIQIWAQHTTSQSKCRITPQFLHFIL
jgi:hypothetical protein